MKSTGIAGFVVIAGMLLFYLSSRWYHQHELNENRQYLQALLSQAPTIDKVEAQLGQDLLYKVATPADANALSHIWTNPANSQAEIETKVTKWPHTRIYMKSPMVYFIYFDANGVMRDFTCLSN